MTLIRKRNARIVICSGLLILMAYICRHVIIPVVEYDRPWSLLRSFIFIFLLSAWTMSIHQRIIQQKSRRYLMAIGFLMIVFIAVRSIKYHWVEDPYYAHWFWYAYYLSLIFIPLFGVFVSAYICKGEEYVLPNAYRLLYIPATLLLGMVLSNDLHQWVFAFPENAMYSDASYSYNFGYYLVVLWMALCTVMAVTKVFSGSRITDKNQRILIPLCIIFLFAVYSVLYGIKNPFITEWFSDYPVMFCVMLVGLFESFFNLNFIPSNSQYEELFRCSFVPAVIVDEHYLEQISTSTYEEIPTDIMRQCEEQPFVMEGVRLSSAPIHGGRVLWQEDISELVQLNERLMSTHLNIEEQNTAELEAYRAEYLRRQVAEKNRLYDILQAQTRHKVDVLEELLKELEKASQTEERGLLLRISVIGAYIKRRSNLCFLSEDWQQFPVRELKNCIEQSLDCLRLFGIDAEQEFSLKEDMLIENTIRFYEVFEEALECSLCSLEELYVQLKRKEDGAHMLMNIVCNEDLSSFDMANVQIKRNGQNEWLIDAVVGRL